MLISRIFSAFIMLLVFLSSLFLFSGSFFSFVIYVTSLLALYEWSKLLYFKSLEKKIFLAISLCFIYLIDKFLTYDHARFILIGASIFWIFIAPLFLVFKIHLKNFYFSSLTGWMLIIPLIVALNYLIQLSPWAVLLVLTTIWLADSSAYFFGKQFGKRKLAPSISPGKTWEGFIGALFVVSLFSITLTYFGFVNSYESILFFILILLLSVEGDLFESYIKRVAKVKDSGDLIPGHGGVLDRIDSLCSSLPLATLILVSPSFFGQLI
ncbi:phosphatidate cytidylyltransferase [Candidatus Methylopumilus universalis]|nr:phosphatidate cytidylyltransferase [Candidatus Methylopumilus universalis]QDC97695.1 phosphatidate cytidylyltransferase [Candidatus Methylopumilus universalis]